MSSLLSRLPSASSSKLMVMDSSGIRLRMLRIKPSFIVVRRDAGSCRLLKHGQGRRHNTVGQVWQGSVCVTNALRRFWPKQGSVCTHEAALVGGALGVTSSDEEENREEVDEDTLPLARLELVLRAAAGAGALATGVSLSSASMSSMVSLPISCFLVMMGAGLGAGFTATAAATLPDLRLASESVPDLLLMLMLRLLLALAPSKPMQQGEGRARCSWSASNEQMCDCSAVCPVPQELGPHIGRGHSIR